MIRQLILFSIPFLGGLVIARMLHWHAGSDDQLLTLWLLLVITPPLIFHAKQNPRTRLRSDSAPTFSLHRLIDKSVALYTVLILIFAAAMAGTLLDIAPAGIFLDGLLPVFPLLLILTPVYVRLFERMTGTTEDPYSRLGARLLGRDKSSWREHKQLLLSFSLKAFFIPLMYGWLHMAAASLLNMDAPTLNNWTVWLFNLGLCIDLLIGASGYLFVSKLFGTEMSSVDDHWLGWASCLVCYPPLFNYLRVATDQVDTFVWTDWLDTSNPLYWLWATLIISSWVIYWLSTVAFGFRFSNLSYRGLIDIGPYRWCKHPAYLAKNIYWWIYTVPFFGGLSVPEVTRNVLGLALLSSVYYLRAKTEERHLSRFPEYQAYAQRIRERSLATRLHHWVTLPTRRQQNLQ